MNKAKGQIKSVQTSLPGDIIDSQFWDKSAEFLYLCRHINASIQLSKSVTQVTENQLL
jgi:hypothetical protein